VAIDGAELFDLDRARIPWRLDPRLPADQQIGDTLYAHNDLDRGHPGAPRRRRLRRPEAEA
jgi:endonuclease G